MPTHLPSHERENLVLQCLSASCYATTYGHDPLEEGELDSIRGRTFRSCCRTELRAQRLEERRREKEGGGVRDDGLAVDDMQLGDDADVGEAQADGTDETRGLI